jgi:hypothetical protein
MKVARLVQKFPLVLLFASPLLCAADLASYRGFHFGMSLSAAARHSGMDFSEATVIHQRPAMIQELNWRPARFSSSDTDPVELVRFNFYNGQLYRMTVSYDTGRTTGLTPADMVQALSAKFGTPTTVGGADALGQQLSVERLGDDQSHLLARWEDADDSLSLVEVPYVSTFQLLIYSKVLNTLAQTALLEDVKRAAAAAPQLAKDKEHEEVDELAKTRSFNKGNFRP